MPSHSCSTLMFQAALVLCVASTSAIAQTCDAVGPINDTFSVSPLYTLAKTEFLDTQGNVTDTVYNSANGATVVGVTPGIDRKDVFYLVFNLRLPSQNAQNAVPAQTIVEIQFTEPLFYPGPWSTGSSQVLVKQLSLQRGAALGSEYSLQVVSIIDEIETEADSYKVKVDLTNGTNNNCPIGQHALRFQVDGLTNQIGEQAVFALAIPLDKPFHFNVQGLVTYQCQGTSCVEPRLGDPFPTGGDSGNCIGIASGQVSTDVPLGADLHIQLAPDQERWDPVIYIDSYWETHRPSGWYLKYYLSSISYLEFVDATGRLLSTVPLPSKCKVVVAQDDLGAHSATLKTKATIKVLNIKGQWFGETTTETDTIGSSWTWTVVDTQPKPLARRTDIPNHTATGSSPDAAPLFIRPCSTIHLNVAQITTIGQNTYVETGATLWLSGQGPVHLTNGANLFVAGNLVVENTVQLQVDTGSQIVYLSGNRRATSMAGVPLGGDAALCHQWKATGPDSIMPLQSRFFSLPGKTPGFEIHARAGWPFTIEIATDNGLFEPSRRQERDDLDFFSSTFGGSSERTAGAVATPWDAPAMTSQFSYYMPSSFWDRALRSGNGKVFYRLVVGQQSYRGYIPMFCWPWEMGCRNFFFSFDDAQYQSAPFFKIYGDLKEDGCVDRTDLDLLLAGIRAGSRDQGLDINGDGSIDLIDTRKLVVLFSKPLGAPCR